MKLSIVMVLSLLCAPMYGMAQGNEGNQAMAGNVNKDECQKLATRLAKLSNKCLRRKNLKNRQACMDTPSKWNVEERLWQGCRAEINPVKENFIAQEKRTYPKQASAMDGNDNRRDDRQHDNGQHNNGNMTASAKECNPLAKRLEGLAKKCLGNKVLAKRKVCMDAPSKWNVEERLWQGCRPQIEPIKQMFLSQEKRRYPKQASAMGNGDDRRNDGGPHHNGQNNGQHNGQHGDMNNQGHNGNMTATAQECKPLMKRLENLAKQCVKKNTTAKRNSCLDQTDKWGVEERLWRGCEEYKKPIKEMFLSEEKRRYPKQASAMDRGGNNGNNNHGGNHNGNHGDMNNQGHNGNMTATAQECKPLMKRLDKLAKQCVKKNTTAKRNSCLDQTDKWGVEERLWRGCEEYKRPIKEAFLSEEKRRYPKQASAMDRGGNNNNHGGDHNNHGDNGNMTATAQECKPLMKRLDKLAKQCVKKNTTAKRNSCLDQTDKWGVEERLWRGCEEYKRPIKEMFLSEEKRRYPKQASAMGGGGNNNNHGDNHNHGNNNHGQHGDANKHGANNGQIDQEQINRCQQFAKVQIRKKGEGCLGRRPASKRKECFDYIGKMLETRKYKGKAIGDLCEVVFEPIKEEYRTREMEKWPNDPSSFQ